MLLLSIFFVRTVGLVTWIFFNTVSFPIWPHLYLFYTIRISRVIHIFLSSGLELVAEPISMSTPQMNYVNENSQNNRKEQRQGNNNNK